MGKSISIFVFLNLSMLWSMYSQTWVYCSWIVPLLRKDRPNIRCYLWYVHDQIRAKTFNLISSAYTSNICSFSVLTTSIRTLHICEVAATTIKPKTNNKKNQRRNRTINFNLINKTLLSWRFDRHFR